MSIWAAASSPSCGLSLWYSHPVRTAFCPPAPCPVRRSPRSAISFGRQHAGAAREMDALEQLRRNHSQAPGPVRLSRYLSYLTPRLPRCSRSTASCSSSPTSSTPPSTPRATPPTRSPPWSTWPTTSARSSSPACGRPFSSRWPARRSRSCWRFSWSFSAFRNPTSATTTL